MSNKTMEIMKKALEKKNANQASQQHQKPAKKIGHAANSHISQKPGGSNNKV